MYAGWDTPVRQLKAEMVQLEYEGYPVPESIRVQVEQLHDTLDAFNEQKIQTLYTAFQNLAQDPNYNYVQPNDLRGIRRERPDGPRQLPLPLNDDELLDRFHGAWTGRACGCALGKPVERLGMVGHAGVNGRQAIRAYLQKRNQWPLDYYFSGQEKDDGMKILFKDSWRENIAGMEPDDDINYSLIGLKVLEEKGPGFKWHDVARTWNSSLPYYAICTAETQAIMNFNLKAPRIGNEVVFPSPAFTRRYNNPYREWIGAQIRADGWAYACAGLPELAAEFAWRDAHWTHTANGIYGEMFVAAMIASAFAESDPHRLVEIGLSEIPKHCKLAEAVRYALKWVQDCPDFEAFMLRLEKDYGTLSPVHTVNNALIVVMSLFYGAMEPDRSICISVMGGLDTDCNGATTGSITGASVGRLNFGGQLAAPLNDTIRSHVIGFQTMTMEELAGRTLAVHKAVRTYTQKRKD
ncbi:MAG: ADP-ribosylglycohydrolase family protein [Deltaproteobacteria bacterium]|nr:ADP-ribosylglycohydrolase family protein [Deltaproteobacteria bacterium]MBW2086249.1 ADP-ribosylglycohydrolase family protein [Deltaproteobacteria bacterium]